MQKKTNRAVRGSSSDVQPRSDGSAIIEPKKKAFNLALFEGGAAAMLRGRKLIAPEGDFREDWAFQQGLDMFEIDCALAIQTYPDAPSALNAFDTWLENTNWVPEEPKLYTVTGWNITLTVPVQSGTVALGVTFEPVLGAEIDDIIKRVKKDLADRFNANWTVPKSGPKEAIPPKNGSSPFKTVHCVELRVEEKSDGRLFSYLMPDEGPWQTYGIPLYKDVAELMGIELPDEPGEFEFEGVIKYEMRENSEKPKRVIGYAK